MTWIKQCVLSQAEKSDTSPSHHISTMMRLLGLMVPPGTPPGLLPINNDKDNAKIGRYHR